MTLGEGKRKVMMLLDEYSSGGQLTTDQDIWLKMNDFFDSAQKDINLARPIIKAASITLNGGFNDLPGNFRNYFRVWDDGKQITPYPVIGGRLYSEEKGKTIVVEYYADPSPIDNTTPDTYVFEVDEDCCNAMPYYVAAQQLTPDLVLDYGAYWNMYLYHKSQISSDKNPSSGMNKVRQALF